MREIDLKKKVEGNFLPAKLFVWSRQLAFCSYSCARFHFCSDRTHGGPTNYLYSKPNNVILRF